MLLGFDLNHLFFFPVEDAQARRRFLIGSLLVLASFIIPIVPYILIIGYTMRIMRQVTAGQKPFMPEWDDWETMFKDGLKLFAVRLAYTLPILLLMIPVFGLFFLAPLMAQSGPDGDAVFSLTMFAFSIFFTCLTPFFFALALIVPAAEAHVVATGELSAGFRVREWWGIFRKNIGGFVVAFMIAYGVSMITSFALQIMIFTIILLCLLPIIIPCYSMYIYIIQYTLFAQAYREGLLKLATPLEAVQE